MGSWVAVDLDRTLAFYDEFRGVGHIGEPIAPMVARVKKWIAEGKDVRIFTARADGGGPADKAIEVWCLKHLGKLLPVTATKDFEMEVMYDDRAVQVEPNTGRLIEGDGSRTIQEMLAGVKQDATALVQQAKDAAAAYSVASNGGTELEHMVAGTLSALKVVVEKNTRR